MANYVGLDFGCTQARVLEAEGTAKKLKIKKFRIFELAPPLEGPVPSILDKEIGVRLDKALSEAKFARDPVAMSWDSALTVFREMDLPFTSAEQIRKVLKFEAESHLLNCDIEDVVVSHYALNQTRDKSHLLVMAVRKDQLLNRLEIADRAGVDPMVVDLDVMATFNALSALGYVEQHKSFMVIDAGRRTTSVLVIADGRLVSGRAIRIGADVVTINVAHDLGTDPAALSGEAKRLLANPDADQAGDLIVPLAAAQPEAGEDEKADTEKTSVELARDLALQRVDDFYGKLTREVRRTLTTTRLTEPVEVVYVTGPGSLMPGFEDAIQAKLGGTPVKRLDLLSRIEHEFKDEEAKTAEAELATALGLAFKMAGHDVTGVDFRQEEARYARKFDLVKEPLLYFCTFLFFLVLLWDLYQVKRISILTPFLVQEQKSDVARMHERAYEEFRAAVGGDAAALPERFRDPGLSSMRYMSQKMNERITMLQGELGRGGGDIPVLPSAFDMWHRVFDAVAPKMDSIGKLVLKDVKVVVRQQKRPFVELNGFVRDASGFEDLRAALRTIPGIEPDAVEKGTEKDFGDHYQFNTLRVYFPERPEYQ